MSEHQYPLRAIAHVSITVEAAEQLVTGFRKDGSAITRLRHKEVAPGETFQIQDERTFRMLVPEGFASLVDELGNEIEAVE